MIMTDDRQQQSQSEHPQKYITATTTGTFCATVMSYQEGNPFMLLDKNISQLHFVFQIWVNAASLISNDKRSIHIQHLLLSRDVMTVRLKVLPALKPAEKTE